jgi:polyisoprenoid-binding protein YceI
MEYKINKEESSITWLGSQRRKSHTGKLEIKQGKVNVVENKITDGYFIVDMNSLEVTDPILGYDEKIKLRNHLKSADFFDVENHPSARFEAKEVRESNGISTHIVYGALTIRGITQNVEFPVNIFPKNGRFEIHAHIELIRTKWHVNHMIDESWGKEKVLPEIKANLNLVFEKAEIYAIPKSPEGSGQSFE